jgi:hypothetical protein
VSAKAQCTPPVVVIALEGSANIQAAGKLQATLEANLPLVFAFQARLGGLADAAGAMQGNISGVADIKLACIPVVAEAAGNAVSDIGASVEVTGQIAGAVGGT